MRTKSRIISAVVVAVLIALFTTGSAAAQRSKARAKAKAKAQASNIDITTLTLTISKDGRSIVDQNGRIVARFVNGMRVQMAPNGDNSEGQMASASSGNEKKQDVKAESQQMKGCLRCHNECLIYDNNGRCVKWYRSCTWDFDCK